MLKENIWYTKTKMRTVMIDMVYDALEIINANEPMLALLALTSYAVTDQICRVRISE